MDLHHEMYMRACDRKLHLAPLDDMKGKRILDIGTGTGIWCIEMGTSTLCLEGSQAYDGQPIRIQTRRSVSIVAHAALHGGA